MKLLLENFIAESMVNKFPYLWPFIAATCFFIVAYRYIFHRYCLYLGSWSKDLKKESNSTIRTRATEQLKEDNVISSLYVTPRLKGHIDRVTANGYALEEMMLICNNPEYVDYYEQAIRDQKPLYNVIPDKGDFRRRIRPNRVMCEDHRHANRFAGTGECESTPV